MGRKIPGKKHRGVKDPKKQQWERKEKLKQVINCPPKDPSIQEIPKSVLELNRLRELVKNGNFKKKKKSKTKNTNNNSNSDQIANGSSKLSESNKKEKVWPSLKQKPGETDGNYFRRIDKATNDIIYEASIEAKHDVKVNQDKAGNVKDAKSTKPEKISTNSNKKKLGESSYMLDRKERMKLRRKLKLKLKKISKIKGEEDAIEKKKDIVQFGEVAHQPPQLKRRPKGCVPEKPGKKELLLKSFFSSKDKSMSEIRHLTAEREKAVKAYEAMKLKNRSVAAPKWL